MRKGIYIRYGTKGTVSGVDKKVRDQIEAFSAYFGMYEILIEKENASIFQSVLWRLPGGSWGAKYDEALDRVKSINKDINGIDFFYIRVMNPDKRFISFLRQLRNLYPGAKVLLEFPTYPYESSLLHSATFWPWYFKNLYHRRYLKSFVDRAVTFSPDNTINGIETIRIRNGISMEDNADPGSEDQDIDSGDTAINLLAVAQFQKAHGYEMVIKSMAHYYRTGDSEKKRKVVVHMVGDGKKKANYEKMVKKYNLEDSIRFYGFLTGEDLEHMYRIADIGLGSFEGDKTKPIVSSSLKVRGYLSHGLPVVSGSDEDAFPDKSEFFFRIPNGCELIDIESIIEFYDNLRDKHDKVEIRRLVREYAKRVVDVNVTMKPVIDFILSES